MVKPGTCLTVAEMCDTYKKQYKFYKENKEKAVFGNSSLVALKGKGLPLMVFRDKVGFFKGFFQCD